MIRQLNEGGAQRQLVELAKALDRDTFDVSLITFYSGGRFEQEAKDIPGIRLHCLHKRGRWDVAALVLRLPRTLRKIRPHLLHGYLSTSNLLCTLFKAVLPDARVIWGVRSSDMDPSSYDWLTRAHYAAERRLSRFADLIIVNSHSAKSYHVAHGFPEAKCLVIPNGIDTQRFRRMPSEGLAFRREIGVGVDETVIGIVARLDPMKDHETFLRAAAILTRARPDVRFLCIGSGPKAYADHLERLTMSLGISSRVLWLGPRADMPSVYSALDVLTLSSSFGEGFPNAVGEAMACGLPCAVTNVGDAALVVAETGKVVERSDPESLADAWQQLAGMSDEARETNGRLARERIEREFSVQTLLARTTSALLRLAHS